MYVFEFRRKNWVGKDIIKPIFWRILSIFENAIDFLVYTDNIDVLEHSHRSEELQLNL